jgi:RimJ/RimL family protein N-acetyltransferase
MHIAQIVNQTTIEADRFDLRPVRRSDAGLIALYAGDARVATHTPNLPYPAPPGMVETMIERWMVDDREEDAWVIDGSKNNLSEVLGIIVLRRIERAQSEITYWIAPGFWNPHDARSLFASVFQDNPASARVLTNIGFQYIGDAEVYAVARGATVATWTYILQLG